MQLSHGVPVRSVVFDEPSLMSHAGLVPAMALAERAGLTTLADRQLSVAGGAGFTAGAKVAALVGGMAAGADSIADMEVLLPGAVPRLFTGIRAPSTLGTFLRGFGSGSRLVCRPERRYGCPQRADRVWSVRPGARRLRLWTADFDGTHRRWGGPDATECRALHCVGQHAGRRAS